MRQEDHLYGNELKKVKIDFNNLKLDCKAFYPGDLVYELMVPRELLKKNDDLKQVHKIIDSVKDAGVITR